MNKIDMRAHGKEVRDRLAADVLKRRTQEVKEMIV